MKLTKRLLAMLLLVCMVFSMLPAIALTASAASVLYEEVAFGDLTTSDTFIVTVTVGDTTYLMNSASGTSATPKLEYTGTISGSKCTFNEDNVVLWKINSDKSICVANDTSKWIYTNGSNNALRVGTTKTGYKWTVDGNYLKAENGRYLSVYGTTDFRSYTSEQSNQVTRIFKQVSTSTYTLSASSNGHGTVGTPVNGTLTCTPDAHYHLDSATVTSGCGLSVSVSGNNVTYSGTQTANAVISVTFAENSRYALTYSDKGVFISPSQVYVGDCVELLAAPTAPEGYTFVGWLPSDCGSQTTKPVGLLIAGSSFTMPAENTTLYAVYAELDEGGSADSGTSTTDLADGNYYLIALHSSNYYAANGAPISKKLLASSVMGSVSNNVLTVSNGLNDSMLYYLDFTGNSATIKHVLSDSYVGGKSGETDITISQTSWTFTPSNGAYIISSFSRTLGYNGSDAFKNYVSSDDVFYLIPPAAACSGYTTNPVATASHTVYWHNGDTYVTTSAKEGTAITAPEEAPTKDDYLETYYTFEGWSATDDGAVVSSYGNMGTTDMHFYAKFASASYNFAAAISGADDVKVGKSKSLSASLTATPSKDTGDYTASWSSSDQSKVTVDTNGKITGLAEGSADITATYTLLDGTTVTATKTIIVLPAAASGSGYTLITQNNVPEDWTGDYIIMGKIGGDTTYMNTWMLLTPNYDSGSAVIATNNKDAATITIEDDGSGIGTGTINDEGNASSGVDKSIVMEDTGLVTGTNGDDSILVYDTITEIDDGYAFTIECIDDVNQIYTIRVKDTNLYLSCSANTSAGDNTLAFDSAATERAQWQFSVQRVTKGGYNNDIIVAQNMGNTTRRLYFNSNSYGGTDGQFRDYHSGAYGSNIGGNASGEGQTYNLYLFGNPNPFKAQIYYHGEQITLVETGKVNANAQTAQLTGALTPDIDNNPNWTQVDDPVWEIVENSNGNQMTIDSATGLVTTNSSTVGSYALIKLTYTVHDEVNNVDKLVSTTSKVEVIDADTTYSTVIYEIYSGENTEVQYTVPNSMSELPLAAYVVNDTTNDNSETGSVVMGGSLYWSITSTSTSMFGTFSIDANGVLHMSNVSKDSIVTVKVTGATGDNTAASDATYKIYVKTADYTLTVVPTTDSQGTYDADSDVLTVAGNENSAHLTYNVVDDQGRGPGADTFTLAGYAWTISGESYGALINSNGLFDFTAVDRSEDRTITAVVSRVAATDAHTGVIKSGLTDTITIVIKAKAEEEKLDAIDDIVIIDWALPVTFNVLKNDVYNVEVSVAAGALPEGVVSNGDGSFTYTPSGWQTTDQTFTYTLSGTVNGAPATDEATVTLKTADSIYYEDTYSGIFTFTGNWTDLTDGTAIAEQTSSLDTADIFEYDANHANYAMYSGGTVKKVTLSKGVSASVSFTFAGTGFDIISATKNNTGIFMLTVKDANGAIVNNPATGLKLSEIVDTYRGYTYVSEGYTRYGLVEVTRYSKDGTVYTANPAGSYYYDSETKTYIENGTWYTCDENTKPDYYSDTNHFTVDPNGSYIVKEFTSNWKPSNAETGDYYQIPVIKITDLPYGTYTVTLKPIYSAVFDRVGDGSYDFYFDGVRIHNPVENRAAEYKYISIHDAVVNGEGFGSGEVVACDHVGHDWSDWTFYSRARNTNSATTNNRGSFVRYCSYCGGVANTAYFHVAVTADATELGVGGYNSLPATTMLRYTLTADDYGDAEVQASIQAKLDSIRGTLTEYWSSNSRAVMTCMNNSNVVIGNGNGTTYATLQLKDPATQTIYASAIHSPMITVYADETHEHTFGDWTHDADSDPDTHTRTCTGESCSFYETEECVFSEKVTLEPTQTETGIKTYTCPVCSYSYEEVIPALGGFTATFHVPEGAAVPAAQTGNSATMPAAVAAPDSFDAHSYTFVGWVESSVTDTTTEQTVYAAGASVALSADTDFYALYSYGGAAGAYTLSSTAPQAGDSVIIATKVDGTYYALSQSSFSGVELTVSGNTATETDGLAWTAYAATQNVNKVPYTGIAFSYDSSHVLHMNGTSINAANGNNNATLVFTASGDGFIVLSNQNSRYLKYSNSKFTVAESEANASTIYFFIAAAGDTYFTTELAKTCHHTGATTTTTVDATCTEAGSTTVTCDDCGKTISTTVLPALGHSWNAVPANTNEAVHTYTCTRSGCSETKTENHDFTNGDCVCGREAPAASAGYTLVTSANDLTNGTYYIAALNGGKYYFVNGNSTDSGIGVEETGVSSDSVTNGFLNASEIPSGAVAVTVTENTERSGYYFIETSSSYLYATSSKTSLTWSSTNSSESFKPNFTQNNSTNGCVLTGSSGSKISQNGSTKSSYIRNYASTGNYYNDIYFFKETSSTKSAAKSIAPASTAKRNVPIGNFGGAVIIDGKGSANAFDDFKAYGPDFSIYLAPGQGIVFSLSSDVDISTQDLQIGAKAVNDTATKMDVASISNGTVSTGIKYLLADQPIASATEMYYELDGSQVGWSGGESSVIVIYNSGEGVLAVTNLRYSTQNNNTLTMNINDVQTSGSKSVSKLRMAMDMLRVVYGTASPKEAAPVVTPSDITPSDIPTTPSESTDPTNPTEPTKPISVDSFKDLDKTAWYMDGVRYAVDNGLMNGISTTEFAPQGTVTRAMLVTILYRLVGAPKNADATLAFTDVKSSDWFYDAVVWAVSNKVTNGTSETTFDPNAPVTREQLVTFLWRYVGEPESKQSLDSFPDGASVSAYARTAMQWAVENKIVNGKEGGRLDPQGNATRAEIAVIFMRAEKNLARPE